ncbi:glyoxalase [Sphingobacterium sp. E70]|uniref:VOC family protein n=1 Tax=Sphingobacterium sp. E70 TaxID=2853439 RepID=UPI00211CF875|nr:glyoxalase [Sphingobacterium sp. E70]ULT25901.1 glyoxalase [Sphingobacterium sp. E70]
MKPKMIWANLAVANLERTQKFYEVLGFKPNNPHTSNDLVSFFFGENDFIIHFFLKNILESNVKDVNFGDSQISNEIIFTLSAESKEQADQWANEVESAGERLYPNRPVSVITIMDLSLLTLMVISLMSSRCS